MLTIVNDTLLVYQTSTRVWSLRALKPINVTNHPEWIAGVMYTNYHTLTPVFQPKHIRRLGISQC